jgi:hypothetical protein
LDDCLAAIVETSIHSTLEYAIISQYSDYVSNLYKSMPVSSEDDSTGYVPLSAAHPQRSVGVTSFAPGSSTVPFSTIMEREGNDDGNAWREDDVGSLDVPVDRKSPVNADNFSSGSPCSPYHGLLFFF